MKTFRRHLLPVLVAVGCGTVFGCTAPESADIVLVNGNIYTLDPDQPQAEAIAIQGDKILFVGSSADMKSYEISSTERVDLEGKTVVSRADGFARPSQRCRVP